MLEHSGSSVVITDPEQADDVEPLVQRVASLTASVLAPGKQSDALTAASPAPTSPD